MSTQEELDRQQEIETQALAMKHAREKRIAALALPKRKTGAIKTAMALLDAAHNGLVYYDNLDGDRSPVAAAAESLFETAIAHVEQLIEANA